MAPNPKSTSAPRFTSQSLNWIQRAAKQKSATWLERNQAEIDLHLLGPYRYLASELKRSLAPQAHDYHFPQKGIGRLKRPGGGYKSWLSYSASRPSPTRFENNPSLFFLIQAEDDDGDHVLVAGGLYMPSSRQVREMRAALSRDTSAFEALFRSKSFSARFPGGFCPEKTSSRVPKGFDPEHPRIDWIKLQAFFVWRSYSRKEFTSRDFPKIVAGDWAQILRLNRLLEQVVGYSNRGAGNSTQRPQLGAKPETDLTNTLAEIEAPQRPMDF